MDFQHCFALWPKLTPAQQQWVLDTLVTRRVPRGTVVHQGGLECTGLVLLKSGQLRAFILSPEGREITLYRLFSMDLCLFSAACMMNSLQFTVTLQAEKDTELWIIPAEVYRDLMAVSPAAANYANEIMATRFTEVMWLMEQVMWKSMDKRVAAFLLEESAIEDSPQLHTTHEAIANHLGTHREVVTRMLRYLQGEGLVHVARGVVEILDPDRLRRYADQE